MINVFIILVCLGYLRSIVAMKLSMLRAWKILISLKKLRPDEFVEEDGEDDGEILEVWPSSFK